MSQTDSHKGTPDASSRPAPWWGVPTARCRLHSRGVAAIAARISTGPRRVRRPQRASTACARAAAAVLRPRTRRDPVQSAADTVHSRGLPREDKHRRSPARSRHGARLCGRWPPLDAHGERLARLRGAVRPAPNKGGSRSPTEPDQTPPPERRRAALPRARRQAAGAVPRPPAPRGPCSGRFQSCPSCRAGRAPTRTAAGPRGPLHHSVRARRARGFHTCAFGARVSARARAWRRAVACVRGARPIECLLLCVCTPSSLQPRPSSLRAASPLQRKSPQSRRA